MRRSGAALALAIGLSLAVQARPAPAQTVCEGSPSAGTLQNGRALQQRSYLRIKRGSEERSWGHAILLHLINRGALSASRAVPGSIALVGDLSGREGGPLPGHASHRTGRDADVGFFASDGEGRPAALEVFETFAGDGRSLSNPDHFFDAYRNWLMLREWLSELRVVVSHVFISAELRELLVEYGRQSPEFQRYVPLAAQLLRPHPAHGNHFHLRIACPTVQGIAILDPSVEP